MKIIGLDLSLTHSGWVVLERNQLSSFGTIIPKKLRGVKRLFYIKQEILKILQHNKPNLVVIEGYAYSRYTGVCSGELGGIIRLLLYTNKIKYLIVAPMTLKKFATGKGGSPKSKMEKCVYKNWNVELKTEHEVDAFALAMLGRYAMLDYIEMTKSQLEAVKTVLEDKSKQNYLKEG